MERKASEISFRAAGDRLRAAGAVRLRAKSVEFQAGVLNVSARTSAMGKHDLCEKIATALQLRSVEVIVERSRLSPGGRSIQCWGRCGERGSGRLKGIRFFAKVFLADPYPIVFKVTAPWERDFEDGPPVRRLGEQIEVEWNTTAQLRALAGDSVPAPLGCSRAAKTIVWENVRAAWVIDTVKRSRWIDPQGSAGAAALFQAGAWLRRLHDVSSVGNETIDAAKVGGVIRGAVEKAGQPGSPYGTTVVRLLDEALPRTGGELVAPKALGHGDFTLANLMWNRRAGRLFVIDYENFAYRSVCYDLLTMVFDIRLQLLNPWIPQRVPVSLEAAFWGGYGPISGELRAFISAVASWQIFYDFLPRMSARRKQRGRLAGATTRVYKALFEPAMVKRYWASVR